MKNQISLSGMCLAAVLLLATVIPILQAQEGEASTLYFPDYADGGGWSVQLAVSNINTTENAAVLVAAYDREGQVLPDFFETEYIFEGRLVSSLASDSFEIPPLGTRVLKSNESHGEVGQPPLRNGSSEGVGSW